MILIIKKIGASTTVHQLEQFLLPVVKGGILSRKGILESLEIKMFNHSDNNVPEYHAIIKVEPDNVAERVINRLNRKLCDGKPVNVCQYHVRYRTNDRRDSLQNVRRDRRVIDRRRKNLEITDVTRTKMVGNAGHSTVVESIRLAANPFDNSFKI